MVALPRCLADCHPYASTTTNWYLFCLQATTKMINSANEQRAAAKCFQNQEKLFLRDVKVRKRDVQSPQGMLRS